MDNTGIDPLDDWKRTQEEKRNGEKIASKNKSASGKKVPVRRR